MSWLWRGNDNSPASFEKALSKLSGQITTANLALETTRRQGRKTKAIWTLYTLLAYTLSLAILTLVIGPHNWSIPHYAGVVGAPLLIFGVRYAISSLFEWRASRQQAHLNTLQKQREEKITALKKATKYDSTQKLLQKYGGGPPKPEPVKETPNKNRKQSQSTPQSRTGMAPPPTANIQRKPDPQSPISAKSPSQAGSPITPRTAQLSPTDPSLVTIEEPGFAPNAFTTDPTYAPTPSHHGGGSGGGNWYDRILDVLIGEDESSARNRIVLLCTNCRLVNGQAPPGVKTAEELGRWRCMQCGAWNGRESEARTLVQQMAEKSEGGTAGVRTEPKFGSVPGEEWERVGKGDDENAAENEKMETSAMDIDEGATGSDLHGVDKESVTKRVTRSAGKDPIDGL